MSKTLYIAYGSNLNIEQMTQRCKTATVLGSTRLTDYQLLFRGGSGAVATIERYKGGKVPVLIWEIGPDDEAAFDRYEGYPVFYRKEYIKVRFKGKWVQVMVYIMNDGRQMGCPNRYYYDVIFQGYKAAGFDTGILDLAVRLSKKKVNGGFENE